MAESFDDAWFAARDEALAALPEQEAAAAVTYTISGGPDGDVVYGIVVEGGRGRLVRGAADGATVEASCGWADGVRIAAGEVAEEVAFMQGRLKLVGDMGTYLRLQRVLQSDAYRRAVGVASSGPR